MWGGLFRRHLPHGYELGHDETGIACSTPRGDRDPAKIEKCKPQPAACTNLWADSYEKS